MQRADLCPAVLPLFAARGPCIGRDLFALWRGSPESGKDAFGAAIARLVRPDYLGTAAIRKLGDLRDAGVGAHFDNFARGFMPLGHLTELPFQGIKLDAVLFENGSSRHHFNALIHVVQSIAQVFTAQLTVTRVESKEMRELLRD